MLKTAITVMKNRYPWITHMRFLDASIDECNRGIITSIPEYSLMLYGKTYYERYYKAYIEKQSTRNIYDDRIARMKSEDEYRKNNIMKVCDIYELREVAEFVEPIYHQARTYLQFFQLLKKKCDENAVRFCEFVAPWGYHFIRNFIMEDISIGSINWLINIENIQAIEVQEWQEPVQTASERFQEREKFRKYYQNQAGGFCFPFFENES